MESKSYRLPEGTLLSLNGLEVIAGNGGLEVEIVKNCQYEMKVTGSVTYDDGHAEYLRGRRFPANSSVANLVAQRYQEIKTKKR